LVFKTRDTWDFIDEILILWENIGIKIQNVKKCKPLTCSTSKIGPKIKSRLENMTITPWRSMEGVKDETRIIAIDYYVQGWVNY